MSRSKDGSPDKAVREKLFALMQSAHEGKAGLEWFQQLAARAGWTRVGDGKGEALALVSSAGLSAGLGIPERTLRRHIADGLPVYRRGLGSQGSIFDVFAVVKWLEESRSIGDAPQVTSEALERYRTAKAEEAERKNKIEEGLLIPVEEARRQVRSIAHTLRGSLEALVKQFPEADAALRSAFDAAVAKLEAEFGLEAVA